MKLIFGILLNICTCSNRDVKYSLLQDMKELVSADADLVGNVRS